MIFRPYSLFLTDKTLQIFLYSIVISMESNSDKLHSLLPSVLTFTANSRHATHIVANRAYSLNIPLVRCKFYLYLTNVASFHKPRLSEIDSYENVSSITTTITHFNFIGNFPHILINFALYLLFCNTLHRVSHGSFTW